MFKSKCKSIPILYTNPKKTHFFNCKVFCRDLNPNTDLDLPTIGSDIKTKKPHTLWKHPTWYSWVSSLAFRSQWSVPMNIFWPRHLDLWPTTLTYERDLDILPLDLHAKIQVRMSVCSLRRATQTHRQTHTHTHTHTISKLLHPTRHRRGV